MGVPAVGENVFHPHHGHGTVTALEGGHAKVKFASGAEHSFEVRPGGAPAQFQQRPGEDASAFTRRAESHVTRILGGTSSFNGRVGLNPNEATLGTMAWDGTLNLSQGVQDSIESGLAGTGRIDNPRAFSVVLHELIHSLGQGVNDRANMTAYGRKSGAAIEEGFTQLGTAHHAAEFFRAMGVGDRETQVLHIEHGETVDLPSGGLAHATMAQWADRLADPKRIKDGTSWGSYPEWTAHAQSWTQGVARAEGLTGKAGHRRTVELSDEVNRAGEAAKPAVMAQQILRALNVPDQETPAGRLSGLLEMEIYTGWLKGESFKAAARMAERYAIQHT